MAGGTAVTVAEIGPYRPQGGWLPADVSMACDGDHIVGSRPSGIWIVPAGGGAVRALVTVDPAVEVALWPRLIDRGRYVLYTLRRVDQSGPDAFSIVVQPVDGGSRKVLVTAGRLGLPLPSGHLAYLRGTDLMAMRFDEASRSVSGESVVIARDVSTQLAVSPTGTLVHMMPAGVANARRSGSIGAAPKSRSEYRAPDGKRFVFPKLANDGKPTIYVVTNWLQEVSATVGAQ